MRFKKALSIMLSLAFILTAGCKKNVPMVEKPKDDIEGKLVIWTNAESKNIINASRLSYLALHEKAAIEVVSVNSEELQTKLNAAIQTNSALPDIICIEDEAAQSVIKNFQNILEDTGDDIKRDSYLRYKIDNLTHDGKLYGIPLNTKPAVLAVRVDILQQAGVNPEYIKTWDDFITAGKSVVKASGKPMTAFTMDNDNLYRSFLNQLGGSYFNKDNKPELNPDKAVRAADMLKKLFASGVIQNTAANFDAAGEIKAGKICSAVVGPEALDSIIKSAPELKGKLQILRLPAYEEGGNEAISMNGSNLLLINSSKSKKLMVDFSKFLTENRDNVKALMTGYGNLTAYTGFYDEKWFSMTDDYLSGQKRWRILSDIAEDIYGVNYTENYSKVRQQIRDVVANIISKGLDSKPALEDLQLKVTDLLK